MIKKTVVYLSKSVNPFFNLAAEEYLLSNIEANECYLFLWQNARTVVVGRNQDIASECDSERLLMDGGFVVRRISGGGAVYHDLGNLNYTFLSAKKEHDISRQMDVVIHAIEMFGIQSTLSGRNDITIDNTKVSGNAFFSNGENSLHHGTIMINVCVDDMVKYLNVPKKKMSVRGIKSVRSRVCNLQEINNSVTVDKMKDTLITQFQISYGIKPIMKVLDEGINEGINLLQKKYMGREWLYRLFEKCPHTKEAVFDWGYVRVQYLMEGDRIAQFSICSDGLDALFIEKLPSTIVGKRIDEALTIMCETSIQTKMLKDIIDLLR